MGILHMTLIILWSGSAELERYHVPYGICIDYVTLMLISELLHRLGIIADKS